jgi:hypothetical protein
MVDAKLQTLTCSYKINRMCLSLQNTSYVEGNITMSWMTSIQKLVKSIKNCSKIELLHITHCGNFVHYYLAGRWWVQVPIRSLDSSIYLILPATLWPWCQLTI